MGPAIEISGGSARQHHRGRRELRRARGLRRQGQGRRARPRLRARHPRRRRRLRHAAGVRRALDRALLHPGDAGRRAHHEHLSRRRAGPAPDRRRRRRRSPAAAITYLEGYLWDPPHAKEAFRKAAKIAHGAGRKVALTLSDAFCVDRYRDEFLNLMRTGAVDLDLRQRERAEEPLRDRRFRHRASTALRNDVKLAVVTRSEKGCVVVSRDEQRGGAGRADRQARRCHRRGRPVRGRLPGRACARPGSPRPRRGSARSRRPR